MLEKLINKLKRIILRVDYENQEIYLRNDTIVSIYDDEVVHYYDLSNLDYATSLTYEEALIYGGW